MRLIHQSHHHPTLPLILLRKLPPQTRKFPILQTPLANNPAIPASIVVDIDVHQPPVARHACTRASYLAKFSACSSAPQTVLAKNRHATGRRKALKPSCLAKRDICAVPSLPPYSWRGGTMEFIVHVPYVSFSSFRNRNWVETDSLF